jgi:glycerol-3-phosphate dehydrogenase
MAARSATHQKKAAQVLDLLASAVNRPCLACRSISTSHLEQWVMDDALRALSAETWDVLIIGGGVTGAGVLLEATRRGLRAALIEQRDFAWGTSSRSSKLVHGGLRYLREGQFKLTRESVRERDRLCRELPALVVKQGFVLPHYRARPPSAWTMQAGLAVYDWLAHRRSRAFWSTQQLLWQVPELAGTGALGASAYEDAKTDDARLVYRLLAEARKYGACAYNYVSATSLIIEAGQVCGVHALRAPGQSVAVRARSVVAATGVWADRLRQQLGGPAMVRPLRGSHLMLPHWRLPLAQSVSFLHPYDGRPVFAYPWEGGTLVGTTDVDHHDSLDEEAHISPEECAYLLAALTWQFPAQRLTRDDVVATWSGVRPVVDGRHVDPSQAGREHVVREESGLITLTGGKLTTFRIMALDALAHVSRLIGCPLALEDRPLFDEARPSFPADTPPDLAHRLEARYGEAAPTVLAAAQSPAERACIPGTETRWLELRWAARHEQVHHLDDLLLRRVRIGLLLADGGRAYFPRIRALCQAELGWSDARWEAEAERYRALWQRHYGVPAAADLPVLDTFLQPRRPRAATHTA